MLVTVTLLKQKPSSQFLAIELRKQIFVTNVRQELHDFLQAVLYILIRDLLSASLHRLASSRKIQGGGQGDCFFEEIVTEVGKEFSCGRPCHIPLAKSLTGFRHRSMKERVI